MANSTDSVKASLLLAPQNSYKNKYENTQIREKYGFDFILRGNVQGAGNKIEYLLKNDRFE